MIFFVLPIMICTSFFAFAAEAEIYADEVQAESGRSVFIPVMIRNNAGLMGWKFTIAYDPLLLKSPTVSAGDVTSGGLFNDSISISDDGSFDVVWCSDSQTDADGVIMILGFSIQDDVREDTKINITYSQSDTFNEKWEDVVLKCSPIQVHIDSNTVTASNNNVTRQDAVSNAEVIQAVDTLLNEFNAASIEAIEKENENAFLVRVNDSLKQMGIEDCTYNTIDSMEQHYFSAVKETFLTDVLDSVNQTDFDQAVEDALAAVGYDSMDALPKDLHKTFLREIISELQKHNADLRNIVDILPEDDCMEVISDIQDREKATMSGLPNTNVNKAGLATNKHIFVIAGIGIGSLVIFVFIFTIRKNRRK